MGSAPCSCQSSWHHWQPSESPLLRFLTQLGFESVDIQPGEGFLNYINGYVAKANDALDFRLKEHLREGQSHRWRMTYRLLCKTSPAIPEIALDFATLPLMKRSFRVGDVYAPVPKDDVDLDQNDSYKFYAAYLRFSRGTSKPPRVDMSFLEFARRYRVVKGVAQQRRLPSGIMIAIGVRFSYELLDISLGQFAVMFAPRCSHRKESHCSRRRDHGLYPLFRGVAAVPRMIASL